MNIGISFESSVIVNKYFDIIDFLSDQYLRTYYDIGIMFVKLNSKNSKIFKDARPIYLHHQRNVSIFWAPPVNTRSSLFTSFTLRTVGFLTVSSFLVVHQTSNGCSWHVVISGGHSLFVNCNSHSLKSARPPSNPCNLVWIWFSFLNPLLFKRRPSLPKS